MIVILCHRTAGLYMANQLFSIFFVVLLFIMLYTIKVRTSLAAFLYILQCMDMCYEARRLKC